MDTLFNAVVCDECCAKLDGNRKQNRSTQAITESLAHRWIAEDVPHHTLVKSNREYENSTAEISRAFEWAREWVPRQQKNSAFLEGSKGAGKSYFAHCLLNVAMDHGMTVREVQAGEIQEMATTWDRKAMTRKMLNELKYVGCLLIEEIGLVPWNDYGTIALREIIDYRYRVHAPVIITSNLSIRELRDEVWSMLKNKSIVPPMLDRMQNFVGFRFIRDSLRTSQ